MRSWPWLVAIKTVAEARWIEEVANLNGRPQVLTAVDRAGGLELWLGTNGGEIVSCKLAGDSAPSLTPYWSAAGIFEAAIHRDFGISFEGAEPFIGELRKVVQSKARQEIPWPGAKDPSDDVASPSRRRALPIGVNQVPSGDLR